MRYSSRELVRGALIAALYVVLTLLSAVFGLSGGVIQFRLSEALCILPCFTPAAVPGLLAGCVLSNLLTGCPLWDVLFGSLATLIGAVGTRLLRKNKWLAPVLPIVANTLMVPALLLLVYQTPGTYGFFALTVGVGEVVCCGVLGLLLHLLIEKRLSQLFR